MQAQHQAQRTQPRWPPLPGWTSTPQKEVPWTMPPKGTMLQKNEPMQAESSLKRPRESGDNIRVKEAPMSGPPRGSKGSMKELRRRLNRQGHHHLLGRFVKKNQRQ